MVNRKPKYILVAPLDWGLGHTARCVPLIAYIRSLGHIPVFAGNASQRSFIEEIFGGIDFIHLEGYKINYSRWNKWGQAGLLSQMPRILNTINSEHKWLLQLSGQRQIDGIISDNRYGLYHPGIPSVILTHQLRVQTGLWNLADRAVQKIHYKYLNRFAATWVVDTPGIPNLGGKLSHTGVLPNRSEYIGLLSRFATMDADIVRRGGWNLEFEPLLMVLLSGPEPQRSGLSRILWQQLQSYNSNAIFIEGSEHAPAPATIPPHITYHKRLAGKELAALLHQAGIIICRSGYSTLMDLVALQKKAILIPTPGQTEQEYLGRLLHTQGIFYCTKQNAFHLQTALNEAQQFPYHSPSLQQSYTLYKKVLEDWIETL